MGLMGSGKTTTGRLVAAESGRPFVDCDAALVERVGRPAAEIARARGMDELHRLEAEVLADALARRAPSVITAAASTVDDASARAALGSALVVWLRADPAVLAPRAATESHRPLGDDIVAQLGAQAAQRDELFAEVADIVVDVARTPAEEVARLVVARLG